MALSPISEARLYLVEAPSTGIFPPQTYRLALIRSPSEKAGVRLLYLWSTSLGTWDDEVIGINKSEFLLCVQDGFIKFSKPLTSVASGQIAFIIPCSRLKKKKKKN